MNEGTDRARKGIVEPVAGTTVPRFAGAATFVRLPTIDECHDYDVAVLGAPFDGGTSFRPGARFGPIAVRTASRNIRPAYHPDLGLSPLRRVQVVDAGDVPVNPFQLTAAMGQIRDHAHELLANHSRLVTIGGDHTIALPLLRAVHERHGPVALVHFDAHLDTWDTYFGSPITHGTVFRRAFEEGLLLEERSVHVGIRGPIYDELDLREDARFGFQIVRARDIDRMGLDEVVASVRRRVGDAPVYLSVDIDVLDPAFAPGTGTPEMGGVTSRELLHLLRGLDGIAIVGGDVVEVAPAYDHAEVTALAAATVVFDIVTLMAKHPLAY
ncbi:MAG TPA: agmatinase [Acidimicrobiales bacterium]|nr:agmatinase [Acidimicrobiales bacterium]